MTDTVVGAHARRSNPALQPLAFLLGEWSTTGTHPAFPGERLPGMTSFTWTEGGSFLCMRSQTDHDDFPDGVAIFSSDNVLGTLMMSWFDERGISRLCPVSVSGSRVSWHHEDPDFMQRMTITCEAGGDRMVSKGEMSKGGGPWGPDLSQVFERRPPARAGGR